MAVDHGIVITLKDPEYMREDHRKIKQDDEGEDRPRIQIRESGL
jgi:hypothetical protein